MAIMWPKRIPYEVRNNELRAAECKVFDRLERQLDSSFVVFYSRPWLGIRPDGSEIDGECDFMVAHPDLGILAIEVKGGLISYDPGSDEWSSKDRFGFRHRIKNPVGQARSSKYQLLAKLRDSADWHSRFIAARHGVIFPDSARPSGDLGPDAPLRIFCFLEDFETDLGEWVRSRFGDTADTSGTEHLLGRDGLKALEKLLAAPFQLNVPLGHYLAEDERALSLLTTEQFRILAALEDVARAAIAGGAGTGKTVLAMEKTARSAGAGLRTLYVCFNRPLAEYVARELRGVQNLGVTTFHGLCKRLSAAASIPEPTGVPEPKLLKDVYPELLVQSLEIKPQERVDCVVVDEGQDFEAHWWAALDAMLDPAGAARLYVFYDSNQRVYGDALNLPREVNLIPVRLTLNLRNTRRIYDVVRPHYRGFPIEPVGPEGTPVEWIEADTSSEQYSKLVQVARRMTGAERIPPEEIAVIVGTNNRLQQIAASGRLSGFPVTRCDVEANGSITVDTVRRFKGLERSVVILLVDPELVDDAELTYVALSRPRSHLVLLGPSPLLKRLRELQQQSTA